MSYPLIFFPVWFSPVSGIQTHRLRIEKGKGRLRMWCAFLATYRLCIEHDGVCVHCSWVHLGIWGFRAGGMHQWRDGRQFRLQDHVVRS